MRNLNTLLLLGLIITLFTHCNRPADLVVTVPPLVNDQVSTFAGSGKVGDRDGAADSAQFVFVTGIAFDATGNLWVADNTNDLLRKISPDRVVTTVAGSGYSMYRKEPLDGQGRTVAFSGLVDLVFDAVGNGYAVEATNRVRKFTPTGQVTTFAVLPSPSFGHGITLDAAGNLFVTGLNCIYKISPAGSVSLFSGQPGVLRGFRDGSADSARFVNPEGLAFDRGGNLFVGDMSTIRKILPDGSVTTIAGNYRQSSLDGIGTAAQFSHPRGLAFDATGNLYIGDYSIIRRMTPDGQVSTLTGRSSSGNRNGTLAAAQFDDIRGLAFDKAGNLYVADRNNRRIRRIAAN